jgi:protein-S-isoprenylcysteine O-methyltransferase Ste14
VPTRRATWLPLAAVVANGLLAGVSLDQSIKQLPARHRIGVTAFAADFVLQPGVVAGLVPWWLTGWQVRQPEPSWAWTPLRVAGVALLAAGILVLVQAFVRFVGEGGGTPAPIAPTQRLVVDGPYRYVRNPMYLAVVAVIIGQALLLGQPGLLGYAAAVGGATAAFAHGYEEPTLRRQFGAQYETYRRAVPAWWPRRPPLGQPGQPGQPARHEP